MMIQERFSTLNKSDKMSLICTAFFWFAFIILSVLIPVQKNNPPEYVSVKLQLLQEPVPAKQNQNVSSEEIKPAAKPLEETAVKESTKIIEETPQKIEKKETVAAVKTEKPVVEKTIEKTVTETKPLVKSVEQLMEENSSVVKKQKDVSEVDWDSLFADDSAVSSSYSAVSETKDVNYENQSSISGTAGSAFIANETLQTSSADNQNTDNSAVMESTVSALNKIATKNFSENSAGGIQYTVTAETSQNAMDLSETGTPMLTAEGKMRLLLIPEKPVILISPENEKFIDSSRELDISFRVLPSGQVESASIKILPASLVATEIEAEIKAQVSKWLFQAASGYGQVCFKYNIMMK